MGLRFQFIAVFLICIKVQAQINLVPNPSFEIYDTCPDLDGQIARAIPWFQPYLPYSSSDYFNSCDSGNFSSVPQNFFGDQFARTGNGYSGIGLGNFTGSNVREYIEIELLDSLGANNKYCVSFYVSCGDYSKRACDAMGAYFSATQVLYSSPPYGLLTFNTQIENQIGNIITDTVGWVQVIDSFIAQGGERFMTIGNFKNDTATNWVTINPNALHLYSYYYFDDISVILCDSATGIETLTVSDVVLSPNPASDRIKIGLAFACQQEARIKMYSSIGALLLESDFREELDVSLLAKGIYFLSVETKKGRVVKKVVLSDD